MLIQLNNFYLSSNHPNERPNDEEDKADSQAAETNHLKSNILIHACHHHDAIHELFTTVLKVLIFGEIFSGEALTDSNSVKFD